MAVTAMHGHKEGLFLESAVFVKGFSWWIAMHLFISIVSHDQYDSDDDVDEKKQERKFIENKYISLPPCRRPRDDSPVQSLGTAVLVAAVLRHDVCKGACRRS